MKLLTAITLIAVSCLACTTRGPNYVKLTATPATIGRALPPQGDRVEEQLAALTKTMHEQLHRSTSEAEEDEIARRANALMGLNDPYVVAAIVQDLVWWAKRGGERRVIKIKSFVDRCIRHEDRLIRWSGVFGAAETGDLDSARRVLCEDYPSLLIRPDKAPWWTVKGCDYFLQRQVARHSPPSAVAARRSNAIRLVGEMELWDAKDVIEAILKDPKEWDPGTRDQAEEAYFRIKYLHNWKILNEAKVDATQDR